MNKLAIIRHGLFLSSLLLVLAGCSSLTPDAGFDSVEKVSRERLNKELKWARTGEEQSATSQQVKKLLEQPLDAEAAVQIALLNNPGLQATYGNLGIADADRAQAGRLHNPGFSFARLDKDGMVEYERKFTFDLMNLFTLSARSKIETRRFEQVKLQVAAEVMRVAAETRRAYIAAVAAEQTAEYMQDVRTSAEASAELAARMAKAGNWSRLDRMRQQVFYAEVVAQQARASAAKLAARENLTRLLGLWGEAAQFKLPARMADLPASPQEMRNPEQTAIEQRLDVQIARQQVEGLASALGLEKATRLVNVLDVSYLSKSSAGEPEQSGFEVELQLPIFDWGDARVAKAESVYMQAINRVTALAVNARSEARTAYAAYRSAHDLARHYRDEVLPLRRMINDENVLRYNGMLIGVFELLADAREQMSSVNTYINALRDYWIADSNLQMSIAGTSASLGGGALLDAAMPSGARAAAH